MIALLCLPRSSNGAYVYFNSNANQGKYPVFLYLYRVPQTGELMWVFAHTLHGKPEDVNNPRSSADTKVNSYVYFDENSKSMIINRKTSKW